METSLVRLLRGDVVVKVAGVTEVCDVDHWKKVAELTVEFEFILMI